MLDRTDRFRLFGIWWWTVDKWLLAGGADPDGAGGATGNGRRTGGGEFDQSAFPAFHGSATALCPAVTCCYDHCLDMAGFKADQALSLVGLAGVIGLMIMAIVAGSEIKGATRWITLFGFNLQPSEFAKPLFAIVSAWLLTLWRERGLSRLDVFDRAVGRSCHHSGAATRYWHDGGDCPDLGLSDVPCWHADAVCHWRSRRCAAGPLCRLSQSRSRHAADQQILRGWIMAGGTRPPASPRVDSLALAPVMAR